MLWPCAIKNQKPKKIKNLIQIFRSWENIIFSPFFTAYHEKVGFLDLIYLKLRICCTIHMLLLTNGPVL